MRSANCGSTLTIVTTVIILLLSSSLAAGDRISCQVCEHDNPSNAIICEQCGYWLVSYDQPITREITQGIKINEVTSEVQGWDVVGLPTTTMKEYVDSLTVALSYRIYFDSRYQHPRVPIRFIPYNHRESYIELTAGMSKSDWNYSWEPYGSGWSGRDYDEIVGSVGGQFHLESRYSKFISARLLYGRMTMDGVESSEWKRKRMESQISFGLYGPRFKVGFGVNSHIENTYYGYDAKVGTVDAQYSDGRKVGSGSAANWQFVQFAEIMMGPRVMVTAAYINRPENDDWEREWRVPLGIKYINTSNWLEMSHGLVYIDRHWGHEIDISFGVRKFFGESELFVLPTYAILENDDSYWGNSTNMYSVAFGGSLVSQRKFMIIPTVTKTWGESSWSEDSDVSGLKFDLVFKGFL